MRNKYLSICLVFLLAFITSSCWSVKSTTHTENASTTVKPNITSYNELTMDLDPVGIYYSIDVTTPEGRMKLDKISLKDAEQLALIEAIMVNNCATLFNPQYTHLKKGNKILRVTVYGFPARYKRKN